MSWLSAIKAVLRDHLDLHPIAVLAALGMLMFLSLNWVLRKPLWSPEGLSAPLLVGVLIETLEIWQHYGGGSCAQGSCESWITIIARHSVDVLAMLSIPAVLVLLGQRLYS